MTGKTWFEMTGKLGPKIDLYLHDPRGMHFWRYQYSTRWHRTARDAKAALVKAGGYSPEQVRARIDRR